MESRPGTVTTTRSGRSSVRSSVSSGGSLRTTSTATRKPPPLPSRSPSRYRSPGRPMMDYTNFDGDMLRDIVHELETLDMSEPGPGLRGSSLERTRRSADSGRRTTSFSPQRSVSRSPSRNSVYTTESAPQPRSILSHGHSAQTTSSSIDVPSLSTYNVETDAHSSYQQPAPPTIPRTSITLTSSSHPLAPEPVTEASLLGASLPQAPQFVPVSQQLPQQPIPDDPGNVSPTYLPAMVPEIKRLKERLENVESEYGIALHDIANLREQLNNSKMTNDTVAKSWERTEADLRSKLTATEAFIANLESTIRAQKEEIERSRSSKQTVSEEQQLAIKQRDDMRHELNSVMEVLASFKATASAQRNEIERLVTAKQSLSEQYESALRSKDTELQETIAKLNRQVQQAERNAREASVKQHQAEAELSLLRQHAGETFSALSVSQLAGTEEKSAMFHQQRIVALEMMLQNRDVELGKLKEELSHLRMAQDRVKWVQQNAAQAEARAETLQAQLDEIPRIAQEIVNAREEVNEIEKQLRESQEQVEVVRRQGAQELQQSREELRRTQDQFTVDRRMLQDEIDQVKRESGRLSNALTSKQKECQERDDKILSLQHVVMDLNTRIVDKESTITNLTSQLTSEMQRTATSSAQTTVEKANHVSLITQLQQEIERLKKKLLKRKEELAMKSKQSQDDQRQLNDKIRSEIELQARLRSVSTDHEKLLTERDTLLRLQASSEEQIRTLDSKYRLLAENKTSLERQLGDVTAQLVSLQKEEQELRTLVSELRKHTDEMAIIQAASEKDLSSERHLNEQYRQTISVQDRKLSELDHAYADCRSSLTVAEQRMSQLSEIEKKYDHERKARARLDAGFRVLKDEVTTLQHKLTTSLTELEGARQQLAQNQKTSEDFRESSETALHEARVQLVTCQQHLATSEEKRRTLAESDDSHRRKLKDAEAQVSTLLAQLRERERTCEEKTKLTEKLDLLRQKLETNLRMSESKLKSAEKQVEDLEHAFGEAKRSAAAADSEAHRLQTRVVELEHKMEILRSNLEVNQRLCQDQDDALTRHRQQMDSKDVQIANLQAEYNRVRSDFDKMESSFQGINQLLEKEQSRSEQLSEESEQARAAVQDLQGRLAAAQQALEAAQRDKEDGAARLEELQSQLGELQQEYENRLASIEEELFQERQRSNDARRTVQQQRQRQQMLGYKLQEDIPGLHVFQENFHAGATTRPSAASPQPSPTRMSSPMKAHLASSALNTSMNSSSVSFEGREGYANKHIQRMKELQSVISQYKQR